MLRQEFELTIREELMTSLTNVSTHAEVSFARLLLVTVVKPKPRVDDGQVRTVVEHIVALVRQGEIGEAEALTGEVKQLGLYVELQQQRWHTADGRAGAMEPFTLSHGAETNGSSGPANGVARESGAAAQAALTDENVKKIVEHVATLVRANQRQQAGDLIEQAAEHGLRIDLQQRRWASADGRSGSVDPFSLDSGNGGATAAAEAPPATQLPDDKVQVVVEHIVTLVRAGQRDQAEQLIAEVKSQCGLYVDLQQQRWQTADGRAGAVEPFTMSSSRPSANGCGGAPGAEASELPNPSAARPQPVSLASVMREQERGKGGAAGILNPRGEFNCFLSVVVQALWHVRDFRDAVMASEGDDTILCALQETFAGLTAANGAAGAPPQPVSVESLRVALSATDAGARFRLGDMADAAEAFEALLERLRDCGAGRAVGQFEYDMHDSVGGSYPQFVLYANVDDIITTANLQRVAQDAESLHLLLPLLLSLLHSPPPSSSCPDCCVCMAQARPLRVRAAPRHLRQRGRQPQDGAEPAVGPHAWPGLGLVAPAQGAALTHARPHRRAARPRQGTIEAVARRGAAAGGVSSHRRAVSR